MTNKEKLVWRQSLNPGNLVAVCRPGFPPTIELVSRASPMYIGVGDLQKFDVATGFKCGNGAAVHHSGTTIEYPTTELIQQAEEGWFWWNITRLYNARYKSLSKPASVKIPPILVSEMLVLMEQIPTEPEEPCTKSTKKF